MWISLRTANFLALIIKGSYFVSSDSGNFHGFLERSPSINKLLSFVYFLLRLPCLPSLYLNIDLALSTEVKSALFSLYINFASVMVGISIPYFNRYSLAIFPLLNGCIIKIGFLFPTLYKSGQYLTAAARPSHKLIAYCRIVRISIYFACKC